MSGYQPRLPKGFERCPICEEPITWRHARIFKTCSSWKCRRSYREQQRVQRHEENEQFAQWHQHRLDCAGIVRETDAARSELEDPHSYAIVVLAANRRRLAPLSRERHSQFVKKLAHLVDSTLANPPDCPTVSSSTDDEETPLMPILATACATCGGHCCLKGGTHAFLCEATVQRYQRVHPDATAHDIVEAYCRFLPSQTYEDGCVFQSATGCTLPRSMRSQTCNSAICSGLIELRDLIRRSGQTRFYLAAMCRDQVIRSKFARQGGRATP